MKKKPSKPKKKVSKREAQDFAECVVFPFSRKALQRELRVLYGISPEEARKKPQKGKD